MNPLIERYLTAAGYTLRHQPITAVTAPEVISRIEAIKTQLTLLARTCSIDMSRDNFYTRFECNDINSATVLLHLAKLEFELVKLYYTFGLARYRDPANGELNNSLLTEFWPDGKLHKSWSGTILYPDDYCPPDMRPILSGQENLDLFTDADTPITHDDDKPITLD